MEDRDKNNQGGRLEGAIGTRWPLSPLLVCTRNAQMRDEEHGTDAPSPLILFPSFNRLNRPLAFGSKRAR